MQLRQAQKKKGPKDRKKVASQCRKTMNWFHWLYFAVAARMTTGQLCAAYKLVSTARYDAGCCLFHDASSHNKNKLLF